MAAKKKDEGDFVRIHFMNNSSKAFKIDSNTNTQKVREIVIERLGLKEHKYFALFEKKEDYGMQYCLSFVSTE